MFFRVLIALIIPLHALVAQEQSDSSVLVEAIRYQKSGYQKSLADNARLYNGSDYKEIILRDYDKGHPYFMSPGWQKGFIEYDGYRYENVNLLYDLVNDKVLIHQYYTLSKIDLVRAKIASFGIGGHIFIQVPQNDPLSKSIKPGFYDRLESGKVSLYVARRKERYEDLTSGKVVQEFRDKDSYFIMKDGGVTEIKTRKDLFKILGNKKTLIKSKLAENGLRFRTQTESSLIFAVKLYNSSI